MGKLFEKFLVNLMVWLFHEIVKATFEPSLNTTFLDKVMYTVTIKCILEYLQN